MVLLKLKIECEIGHYKTFFPSRKYLSSLQSFQGLEIVIEELKKRETIALITLLAAYIVLSAYLPQYIKYSDVKEFYIPAGLSYINGASPDKVNFEHPPLAKYIIGLSVELSGQVYISSVIFTLIFLCGLWNLLRILFNNVTLCTITLILLILDPLFINVSRSGLLDVYMNSFLVWSLYYYVKSQGMLKRNYIVLSGILGGLATASKWPALYIILAIILYSIIRYRNYEKRVIIKGLTLFITLIILTYMTTYTVYFIKGNNIIDFINLQLKMVNYHISRHEYTLMMMFNGILRTFFKMEIHEAWYLGQYHFIISSSNGTYTILTQLLKPPEFQGVKIYLNLGSDGLSHLLFLWAIVNTTYMCYLKWKNKQTLYKEPLILTLATSSILNVLHAPIDWYLYNTLPYLYMLLASNIQDNKKAILLCILLNLASLIFLISGITKLSFLIRA